MIERILKHRLEEELQKIEKLGLVKKIGSGNTIFDYENVGIDSKKVDDVYIQLLNNSGLRAGKRHVNINGEDVVVEDLTPRDVQNMKALALAIVVNDGMVKAIVSKNETERIFSGHPAFFKILYDEQGNLVDRSTDEHKRYGGLVSTGQNAALWAKGIPSTYISAEIDNEKVSSDQIDMLIKTIEEGQIRQAYLNYLFDLNRITIEDESASKYSTLVDSMSVEEIKEQLRKVDKENGTEILKIAEKLAKEKAQSFASGIDVADGGAYVTDTMFENLLKSVGNYTSNIERAFKILRGEEVDGRVYTVKDTLEIAKAYEEVWTSVIGNQKYTAYGLRSQNRTCVPYYDKFALFPLFKVIATGRMADIYQAMLDQKVDMLKIQSAVKIGSQGSKKINWSDYSVDNDDTNADNFVDHKLGGTRKPFFNDKENGFVFNTYVQKMKNLRKQFNTDPNEKELLTMGTQMTKIIMQSLVPGRTYTTRDGRQLSAKALRDDIMDSIRKIAKHGEISLRAELFHNDGTLNLKAFSKLMKDELSRRGASRDMIDGFTVISEGGKDRFKVTMGAQGDVNWIQSIIASAVNKKVVDINTPGNLFIQRSVWGMQGKTTLVNDKNIPSSLNNGNKLKMINEHGAMDCILSIDFFDHLLPRVDGKRLPFKEAKQWLIDNDIISGVKTGQTEWSNAETNIIGYRIPTQAISSIHALRCVDVLPVVRDTVILPEEFTKITGSDFDIDKLFLSTMSYKKEGDKLTYNFDKGTQEYEQNKLILDYLSLLTDTDENGIPRSVHLLHASIDRDTNLLDTIIEDLESGHKKKERLTYQDYTLSNEVFIKQDFITGKVGIGPFALNNNNHILTMLYGVAFNKEKGSIITRLNLTRLDRAIDRDQNSILSYLSGLINIHVDAAKDPKHNKLNINAFTYNMTNLLIRTGLGRYTFYFLTQPILIKLAEIYNNSVGVYGVDKSKTTSAVRREQREKFIINYINQNLGVEFKEYEYKKAIAEWKDRMTKNGININQAIDYLFNKNVTLLHDVSKEFKKTGDTVGNEDNSQLLYTIETRSGKHVISTFELQMLVYEAFTQFEPYANALSDVVKYSKIDTKKQGKNISEQQQYEEGVYNTFVNPRGIRRMFTSSLYNMYNNSYIKTKTELALSAFEDILSGQLIQATPQFKQQLFGRGVKLGLLDILNKKSEYRTADLIQKCSDAILSWIKSKYINEYAKRHNINIKELVDGNNTLYDRLLKLSVDLLIDEKYEDLLDMSGNINNYLLNALVTGVNQEIEQVTKQKDTYQHVKFVKLLNVFEDDQLDSDQLRSSWNDLLNDARFPELQEFARDLIVYSFVVNSNSGGIKNLNKFVPNSWKILPDGDPNQLSYNQYMNIILFSYNKNIAKDPDYQDIILNNWYDYNFIPKERIANRFKCYYPHMLDYPIILAGIRQNDDGTVSPTYNQDKDSENYRPVPMFISVENDSPDIDLYSQARYNIYKHVAWGYQKDKDGNDFVYPIYILTNKKGNLFEKGNSISEYGRSDSSFNFIEQVINEDVLLSSMYNISKQKFTSIEEILDQLSSSVGRIHKAIDIYNKIFNTDYQVDETLLQIISDYRQWVSIVKDEASHHVLKQKYSRQSVEDDPKTLYIFTDNVDRTSGQAPVDPSSWYAVKYGNSDTQLMYPLTSSAQIRGLSNAFPISTKRSDDFNKKIGLFKDEDIEFVKTVVEDELLDIQNAWLSGVYKNIVLPYGNSFVDNRQSNITKELTPLLYEYFSQVETRIRKLVENGELLVEEEPRTFEPGTNAEKSLLEYEFNNSYDVLNHISQNFKDSPYKLFAEKLLNYAKDHSVKIEYPNVSENDDLNGRYYPNEDVIRINRNKKVVIRNQNEVIIHEILHSLTSKWLNSHKEDSDRIMSLAEYAKQKILEQDLLPEDRIPKLFKNAKEFLTYATTSEKFRDILSQIKPMDSDKYRSLFEQLLDNIKEIIHKIIGKQDQSVLDQIDPIVDKVLDLQKQFNNNSNNDSFDSIELPKEEQERLDAQNRVRNSMRGYNTFKSARKKAYEVLKKINEERAAQNKQKFGMIFEEKTNNAFLTLNSGTRPTKLDKQIPLWYNSLSSDDKVSTALLLEQGEYVGNIRESDEQMFKDILKNLGKDMLTDKNKCGG